MTDKDKADHYLLVSLQSQAEALEAAAVALTDLGADGVIEEETSTGYLVKAYFRAEDWPAIKPELLDRLELVRHYFPSLMLIEETEAQNTDWQEAWKSFHQPITVGRLWVGPPWQQDKAESGLEKLIIDPGQAFGTGAHATTRLCLEGLTALLDKPEAAAPQKMLDVGTGSGVLALAALKLGVGRALGTDIDPLAVEAAAENAMVNGLGDRLEVSDTPLEDITETYPLVTANLTGPIHLKLLAQMAAVIEPGGLLLASGILIDEAQGIIEAYTPYLKYLKSRHSGEWAGLVFQKRQG